ncbi:MAG TPA: hypothetical protein VKD91_11040 [Pyrinomonadaceae bacterium]|nr:hypothetical protein [Pyrinomonadaceae bacterium]
MISRRTILKGMALSSLGGLPLTGLSFGRLQQKPVERKETKIFDPADGFQSLTDVYILTDSTVVKRDNRWWMYLAGRAQNRESIELFSASLPPGAPLAASGWTLTASPVDKTKIADLAGHEASKGWDLKGGRHCPAYVKGWDPSRRVTVERIYYAGSATSPWGPYTIGYLEWDRTRWVDQAAPVFTANEEWEHGSVYEPNLIYHEGKWKMWYVAGSNQDDYIVQGYAESVDGRTNWTKHQIVFPAEEKVFDFCVIQTGRGFEAVFARVWLGKSGMPPLTTGLWWCQAKTPSPKVADWSRPIQIMPMSDSPWHLGGAWKPSVQYSESDPSRMLVFFDGLYQRKEPAPFPFVFTLGCLEVARPA